MANTRKASPGRWIGPSQRAPTDNTQHPQETDTHVPGAIRNPSPSKRAAADLRFRPRGHWLRPTDIHFHKLEPFVE